MLFPIEDINPIDETISKLNQIIILMIYLFIRGKLTAFMFTQLYRNKTKHVNYLFHNALEICVSNNPLNTNLFDDKKLISFLMECTLI